MVGLVSAVGVTGLKKVISEDAATGSCDRLAS